MKKWMMIVLTALALNSQAGTIAWEMSQRMLDSFNDVSNEEASHIHFFLILESAMPDIVMMANGGTFDDTATGIIGSWTAPIGDVQPMYSTSDRTDITEGGLYSVSLFVIFQFPPEIVDQYGDVLNGMTGYWFSYGPSDVYANGTTSPTFFDYYDYHKDNGDGAMIAYTPSTIPEPATGLLALVGGGLLLLRRKRK